MRKLGAEAQAEVDRLCDSKSGVVRAAEVVEFARNPRTALHSYFTWDDGEAAERWRIEEARQVLRIYVIKVQPDPKQIDVTVEPSETRGFLSSPIDRINGGGYRRTGSILRDETFRAAQLDLAKRELNGFRVRYRHLQELAQVLVAVDALLDEELAATGT